MYIVLLIRVMEKSDGRRFQREGVEESLIFEDC